MTARAAPEVYALCDWRSKFLFGLVSRIWILDLEVGLQIKVCVHYDLYTMI